MKGEGLININYNIFWIIADEIDLVCGLPQNMQVNVGNTREFKKEY